MAETTTLTIECKQLSKSFGDFHAVKNISLKIQERSIIGIAGANGAGKTTFLKLLAGLLHPSSGEIISRGKSIKDNPRQYLATLGLLLDDSFLYDDLTLHDNFEFHAKLHGWFNRQLHEKKLHELARFLNISDWLQEPARTLSRGMRRKADILRTLIHDPEIILLDEPFAALDVPSIQVLISLLQKARDESGATIILSSHDIPILKNLCDVVVVLKKGRINKIFSKNDLDKVSIEEYL